MTRNSDPDVRDSKRMSRVLRFGEDIPHDEHGWFSVEDASKATGLSEERVLEVARINHRYETSEDARLIRAHHGHGIDVVYEDAVVPPDVLYHGTSERGYEGIMASGAIRPMGRAMVHLSATAEYALEVGSRRGKPVILEVDSKCMHADGFVFYLSGDGVYLVSEVPVEYTRASLTSCSEAKS